MIVGCGRLWLIEFDSFWPIHLWLCVCHGGKGGGKTQKKLGSDGDGTPKGGTRKVRAFLSTDLFFFSLVSSRGRLVVFEAPGPDMCTFRSGVPGCTGVRLLLLVLVMCSWQQVLVFYVTLGDDSRL